MARRQLLHLRAAMQTKPASLISKWSCFSLSAAPPDVFLGRRPLWIIYCVNLMISNQ